jgi:hypothetical protein
VILHVRAKKKIGTGTKRNRRYSHMTQKESEDKVLSNDSRTGRNLEQTSDVRHKA